jgi:hypothetical protein
MYHIPLVKSVPSERRDEKDEDLGARGCSGAQGLQGNFLEGNISQVSQRLDRASLTYSVDVGPIKGSIGRVGSGDLGDVNCNKAIALLLKHYHVTVMVDVPGGALGRARTW